MDKTEKEMLLDIQESCIRINGTGLGHAEAHLFTREAVIEIYLRLGPEDLRREIYDRYYAVKNSTQGEERIRELNAVRNKMRSWEKIKIDALKASKGDWKIDLPAPFTDK